MYCAHTCEVLGLTHQFFTFLLFLKRVGEDSVEGVLDLVSITDFVDQSVDIALSWALIHLTL